MEGAKGLKIEVGVTEVGPVTVDVVVEPVATDSDKVKGIMVSLKWIAESSNLSSFLMLLMWLLVMLWFESSMGRSKIVRIPFV